jgi:hypothetical protein
VNTTATTATSAASIAAAAAHEGRSTQSSPRMRAVTQDRYGDSAVLRVEEIDRPTVRPDEVLI